jgi:dTDP-4-dehydrorhamnose reductase
MSGKTEGKMVDVENKILIFGAGGQLGRAFVKLLQAQGYAYLAYDKEGCDITDHDKVKEIVKETKPVIIINCAAYNDVDGAEEASDLAYAVNTHAVTNLAKVCQKNNIFLVHFSTDFVFDGEKNDFYTERDTPNPLSVYGRSKWEGEEAVKKNLAEYLLFRVSWVFGDGPQSMLRKIEAWAKSGRIIRVTADRVSVPTYAEDIAAITLKAFKAGLKGLYHLTNTGYASRYELAKFYIEKVELDNVVLPVPATYFKDKASRPYFSCMSHERLRKDLDTLIPSWEDAVVRYVLEHVD